jgi:hypothetical protein
MLHYQKYNILIPVFIIVLIGISMVGYNEKIPTKRTTQICYNTIGGEYQCVVASQQ